ncbi:MAG: hypothetical protein U0411_15815 [Thermodesulfovibrionales bacterium]
METVYRGVAGIGESGEGPYPRGVLRRISWGAIFAGTVVALVIGLALSLLGMGIGLGTINPATEENPLGGVGVGAGIWAAVSALLSLFAGGWVAGRLAGFPRSPIGILHGVVVWGVVTLFSFYLMTTAVGTLVSGVAGVIGKGISLIGSGITAAVPSGTVRGEGADTSLDSVMSQARNLILQRGKATPGMPDEEVQQAVQRLLSASTATEQDRTTVINLLTARTDMSHEEATRVVDGWLQAKAQARQAAGTALQVTGDTMDTLSKAALWAFVAVVLGAVAAAVGGSLGAPKGVVVPAERVQ